MEAARSSLTETTCHSKASACDAKSHTPQRSMAGLEAWLTLETCHQRDVVSWKGHHSRAPTEKPAHSNLVAQTIHPSKDLEGLANRVLAVTEQEEDADEAVQADCRRDVIPVNGMDDATMHGDATVLACSAEKRLVRGRVPGDAAARDRWAD